MPYQFALICESPADFRTATVLAERAICEHVDWVDADLLAGCPLWHEFEPGRPFILWTEVPHLADQASVPKVRGKFGESSAEPDARTALRALRLLNKLRGDSLDGVLLIRDDDADPRHRTGLEQARGGKHTFRGQIVIGLAHCMRECWVLTGFDPANPEEIALLDKIRSDLGFDPRTRSEDLTASDKADKKSPKRVLDHLTGKNLDRESSCWLHASLNLMRERSRQNGLAEFLDEVEARLVPLFRQPPRDQLRP